jgi:hypothetical protein
MSSDTPTPTASSSGSKRPGGRPLGVYGILAAGVATLLVLLGIIYWSSGDRDRPERPICTNITLDEARASVYAGEVEQLVVNYDESGDPVSGDRYGPVVASMTYVNGQCGNLPQGVVTADQIYTLLGIIEFYNDTTQSTQVNVIKERNEALADSLYWTPTAIPTETPLPTETPQPTATAEATTAPTIEATEPPAASASPEASPAVIP